MDTARLIMRIQKLYDWVSLVYSTRLGPLDPIYDNVQYILNKSDKDSKGTNILSDTSTYEVKI